MQINDLIDRVERLDGGADIARDLRKFVNKRRLGLVYEESKPEYVRLTSKPVVEGDLVNVLPPRGTMEDMSSDDEADEIWIVDLVADGVAHLVAVEGSDTREAAYDDLVAVARFDQTIYCGLTETGRVELGGDKPYHAIINGENFHALELLLFPYFQSVDCIYIDPPYNTGAKDWKYNNNYVGVDDTYRHSKWLTFMEDRLRLAKKLLNPKNSVLIVTIDEKEYLRLGLLLEQIFPPSETGNNQVRIQMVTIVNHPFGQERNHQMARVEEYAFFVYLGDAAALPVEDAFLTMPRDINKIISDMTAEEEGDEEEEAPGTVRWERLLRGGGDATRRKNPNLFYPVFIDPSIKRIVSVGDPLPIDADRNDTDVPDGLVAVWPLRTNGSEGRWRCQPSYFRDLASKGFAKVGQYDRTNDRWSLLYLSKAQLRRIELGEIRIVSRDQNNVVELSLVSELEKRTTMSNKTVWNRDSHDAGIYGTQLNSQFIPGRAFPYPKSLYAVEDTISSVISANPDALIVDFFSGSGTTAHATMRLNHRDGGRRRSISVTNNEVGFDEVKRFVAQGLRQGDDDWEAFGIARYITIPRITAAMTGITPDGIPVEGDYKFTDEFPMADGFQENAVFYDLKYLEPSVITANLAFDEIAPLLWMRAGSVGPIITLGDTDPEDATYEVTNAYGVLFDYAWAPEFIEECREHDVDHVFVVTDVDRQYRDMCAEFRGKDVRQLYKSYLRSFEIGQDR